MILYVTQMCRIRLIYLCEHIHTSIEIYVEKYCIGTVLELSHILCCVVSKLCFAITVLS